MALIFSGSTDLLSSQRTSRFIAPILRWFVPDLSAEAVYRVQYAVRKVGHLTEYAVLAVLLWRARRRPHKEERRPWSWPEAGVALGLAALYALTDEYHQSLLSTRFGSGADVLIDVAGAAGGLALVWLVGRLRRRW
jgi:VanZ family protein